MSDYLDMTGKLQEKKSRFVLEVNHYCQKGGNLKRNFFKNQKLRCGTLPRYVKEACDSVGMMGEGVSDHFTAHGLHTTVVTLLLEADPNEQLICKKTGHRNPKSVRWHTSKVTAI